MEAFLHRVGKKARRRIIEVLALSRSRRDLAEQLGVSATAVVKYLEGRTHPSDEVLARAIGIASPEEKREISEIIGEDLRESIEDFINWCIEEGAFPGKILSEIEKSILKAKLTVVGARVEPGP
ncbi:MAG: helix-turn-helix domain-containing protein [Desulfurococcales archaeon]|nr:helix-turn-helix domain-containing protein [Desulfurococcales archaeon]